MRVRTGPFRRSVAVCACATLLLALVLLLCGAGPAPARVHAVNVAASRHTAARVQTKRAREDAAALRHATVRLRRRQHQRQAVSTRLSREVAMVLARWYWSQPEGARNAWGVDDRAIVRQFFTSVSANEGKSEMKGGDTAPITAADVALMHWIRTALVTATDLPRDPQRHSAAAVAKWVETEFASRYDTATRVGGALNPTPGSSTPATASSTATPVAVPTATPTAVAGGAFVMPTLRRVTAAEQKVSDGSALRVPERRVVADDSKRVGAAPGDGALPVSVASGGLVPDSAGVSDGEWTWGVECEEHNLHIQPFVKDAVPIWQIRVGRAPGAVHDVVIVTDHSTYNNAQPGAAVVTIPEFAFPPLPLYVAPKPPAGSTDAKLQDAHARAVTATQQSVSLVRHTIEAFEAAADRAMPVVGTPVPLVAFATEIVAQMNARHMSAAVSELYDAAKLVFLTKEKDMREWSVRRYPGTGTGGALYRSFQTNFGLPVAACASQALRELHFVPTALRDVNLEDDARAMRFDAARYAARELLLTDATLKAAVASWSRAPDNLSARKVGRLRAQLLGAFTVLGHNALYWAVMENPVLRVDTITFGDDDEPQPTVFTGDNSPKNFFEFLFKSPIESVFKKLAPQLQKAITAWVAAKSGDAGAAGYLDLLLLHLSGNGTPRIVNVNRALANARRDRQCALLGAGSPKAAARTAAIAKLRWLLAAFGNDLQPRLSTGEDAPSSTSASGAQGAKAYALARTVVRKRWFVADKPTRVEVPCVVAETRRQDHRINIATQHFLTADLVDLLSPVLGVFTWAGEPNTWPTMESHGLGGPVPAPTATTSTTTSAARSAAAGPAPKRA